MKRLLASVLILAVQATQAQIGLPSVRLPLPAQIQLPARSALESTVQERPLESTHLQRIRELLRRNRAMLESDPRGAPIVRSEILALSPSDAQLAAAQAAGFAVARTRLLEGWGARLVVLQAPQGVATRRALERLRALMPAVPLDFNHIYLESAASPEEPIGTRSPMTPTQAAAQSGHGRVGLIDTGIDVAHPVFAEVSIHSHGCAAGQIPAAHGTAVASLIVGRTADFHGAAAGMELYAADVYCGLATGGAVDSVVEALAWLAHESVPVINVSLVGPSNVMLAAAIQRMIARGHLIVAAVGNEGPAAAPLYPASYPGVVGVTAVDARRHVLIEACQGPQVQFAAPGADMAAARSPDTFEIVRGTSFAAPLVAGLLASLVSETDPTAAEQAVRELSRQAIDLGAPGRDKTYGYGLVGADLGPQPKLANLRAPPAE